MGGVAGKINKEILEPLGLTCYGGGTKDGKMSYIVYHKNGQCYELTSDEFNNIEQYFIDLRKNKIESL